MQTFWTTLFPSSSGSSRQTNCTVTKHHIFYIRHSSIILNRDITTFTGVLPTQQTSVSHAGSWCQPSAPRTTCADCPVPAVTGSAKHELHALHALYLGLSPGATILGYLPALQGSVLPKAQAPLVKSAMWCYTDSCICNVSTMVSRSC